MPGRPKKIEDTWIEILIGQKQYLLDAAWFWFAHGFEMLMKCKNDETSLRKWWKIIWLIYIVSIFSNKCLFRVKKIIRIYAHTTPNRFKTDFIQYNYHFFPYDVATHILRFYKNNSYSSSS